MIIPGLYLGHRVTVEPFEGTGAYGPVYGSPVADVPALVSTTHRMTRDRTGAQVLSTAQVICQPDVNCPVGSHITLPDGRMTTAISVGHHTAPGLPVPENIEVMCE